MLNKVRKAVLVIFITCLIWVWADLSLDDVLEGQNITISASRANPKLLVTIENAPEVQIKADLSGPQAKIGKLTDDIESRKVEMQVLFDAEKYNMNKTGQYAIQDVKRFLADSKTIKQYGLTVKAATPATLKINVVELTEKNLPIKCIDGETGNEIAGAKITPDIIKILADEQATFAAVKLTSVNEKKQARGGAIEKKPFVELFSGEMRTADDTVKIELPMVQEDMKQYTISGTLGFILSANLIGKYDVEFMKRPEIGSIMILATDEAKIAYEQKTFEVLLEINDDDVGKEQISRQLIYNFPEKYIKEDKIRLKSDPIEAKFKVVERKTNTVN